MRSPIFREWKDEEHFTRLAPVLRPTWDSVRDSSPTSSITTLFRVDLSRTGRPVDQPHLATRALRRNRFSGALSRLNVAPFNFTRGRTFATSIQLSRPSGHPIKGKLMPNQPVQFNVHFCRLPIMLLHRSKGTEHYYL